MQCIKEKVLAQSCLLLCKPSDEMMKKIKIFRLCSLTSLLLNQQLKLRRREGKNVEL